MPIEENITQVNRLANADTIIVLSTETKLSAPAHEDLPERTDDFLSGVSTL